ncbi:MAG TPA: hypothetical protein VFB62_03655, partial [Polyangiaceae bacterium]|nr:hypothetical protein [Polyangiaceae bacterium]
LGWWSALGRDGAILAWAAVHDLGEAKSETKEVEARRVEATSALAAARAELWTSEAKGFDRDQRLPRRISMRRKGRADKP